MTTKTVREEPHAQPGAFDNSCFAVAGAEGQARFAHAFGVIAGLIVGAPLWFAYDAKEEAQKNFLFYIIVNEVQVFTRPTGAIQDWAKYKKIRKHTAVQNNITSCHRSVREVDFNRKKTHSKYPWDIGDHICLAGSSVRTRVRFSC